MKKFRTLIRVMRADDDFVYAVIPCVSTKEEALIKKSTIPESILETIEKGLEENGVHRLHAICDLCVDVKDLKFSQWDKD